MSSSSTLPTLAPGAPAYAELHCLSNFSFLEGASGAAELVQQAAFLGLQAIAITDRNTLAGVVRAHVAAKDSGVQLIIGTRLDFQDAPSVVCLPTDRAAYGRLASLLTIGRRRAPKGECHLFWSDFLNFTEGQQVIALALDLVDDDYCGRLGYIARAGRGGRY